MGTYSLEVTDSVVSTIGDFVENQCIGESLLVGLNTTGIARYIACKRFCDGISDTPANMQIRLAFSLIKPSIKLDGGSLIAFAGLPNGFIPTSGTLTIAVGKSSFGGSAFMQFDAATEQSITIPAGPVSRTFVYPTPSNLSAVRLFSNGWGMRFSGLVSFNNFYFGAGGTSVRITGNYSISAFTFTLSDPLAGNKVRPRDRITISSPNGGLGGVTSNNGNGTSNIDIYWVDSLGVSHSLNIPTTSIVEQTAYVLIFILFEFIPFDQLPPNNIPIIIVITGDGVIFSGSFPIGTLTIITDVGSGIYQITKNKRNDTLYDHFSTTIIEVSNTFELEDEIEEPNYLSPNVTTSLDYLEEESIDNDLAFVNFTTNIVETQTTSVKIPNPFVKTGFIGG